MSHRCALVLLAAVSPALLAACGSDSADGAATGPAVSVSASDDACRLDRTELPAGDTTFDVTNDGSSVTEVYVYGQDDGAYTTVLGEAEDIGPGTSKQLRASLSEGTYEVACKPDQTGDGIRTRVTVTSGAGASSSG